MTVGEMTSKMTALEETYWIAKAAEAPLPTQQLVMHLAQIAMWIQHVNVSKKQDRGKLTDFLLFFKKKESTEDSVDYKIRSLFGISKDK
jgi:hypothetical protein